MQSVLQQCLSVHSQHHVMHGHSCNYFKWYCGGTDPVNEAWAILVFNNGTFTNVEIGDWIDNYPRAVSSVDQGRHSGHPHTCCLKLHNVATCCPKLQNVAKLQYLNAPFSLNGGALSG